MERYITIAVGLILVLAPVFAYLIHLRNKARAEGYEKELDRAYQKELATRRKTEEEREIQSGEKMVDLGLECEKCGELALPIPETGDRYRCDKCGHQFAGAKHGL